MGAGMGRVKLAVYRKRPRWLTRWAMRAVFEIHWESVTPITPPKP